MLKFVDTNECLSDPCGPNTICTNLPGTYSCSCAKGFIQDVLGCKGKLF